MTEAPPSTAPPSTLDRATIESGAATARRRPRLNPRAAITGVLSIAIIGLAIWYLARPEPLLVQGEAQSTRIDIAARVSGRLAKIPVVRGQDVTAGATLLEIDNPEPVAELHEAEAEKMVADAELARINVGTRQEGERDDEAECCATENPCADADLIERIARIIADSTDTYILSARGIASEIVAIMREGKS